MRGPSVLLDTLNTDLQTGHIYGVLCLHIVTCVSTGSLHTHLPIPYCGSMNTRPSAGSFSFGPD